MTLIQRRGAADATTTHASERPGGGTRLRPGLAHLALALLISLLSAPAHAVRWSFVEREAVQGPVLNQVVIDEVLIDSASPRLDLRKDRSPEEARMLDALTEGLSFDDGFMMSGVAQLLAKFPSERKPTLTLNLVMGPGAGIEQQESTPGDFRRLWRVELRGCQWRDIPDCRYDVRASTEYGLGAAALLQTLRNCRRALRAAAADGEPGTAIVMAALRSGPAA